MGIEQNIRNYKKNISKNIKIIGKKWKFFRKLKK